MNSGDEGEENTFGPPLRSRDSISNLSNYFFLLLILFYKKVRKVLEKYLDDFLMIKQYHDQLYQELPKRSLFRKSPAHQKPLK
jgi:hypothetical protein